MPKLYTEHREVILSEHKYAVQKHLKLPEVAVNTLGCVSLSAINMLIYDKKHKAGRSVSLLMTIE